MSSAEVLALPPTKEPAFDRVEAIRALAVENAAVVARLRMTQIPHHVGMAAACRQLAVELPGILLAQVDADLRSGALAKRWEEVRASAAETSAQGAGEASVPALAHLLREQIRAAMCHIAGRGKDWTADALRLEGEATALAGQAERLLRVAEARSGESAPLGQAAGALDQASRDASGDGLKAAG